MSGYGMDEDLKKSAEVGFSDHIVKPADFAQLERAIRRVREHGMGRESQPLKTVRVEQLI